MTLAPLLVLLTCAAAQGPVLEGGVFAAAPAALGTGFVFGPRLGASWASGPLALGLTLGAGRVAENDLTWAVRHDELRLAVSGAWLYTLGRGQLGLTLAGGALAVHEVRARHQADRLVDAGLDPETSAFSAGVFSGLELGARLFVTEHWGAGVGGGPSLTFVPGIENAVRAGWSFAVSVAYRFGGPLEAPR